MTTPQSFPRRPAATSDPLRLRALKSYGAFDAQPNASLDVVAALAAQICGTPTAMITLVDDARQFFLSHQGYDGPRTAPFEDGFCPFVVEAGEPIVIPDIKAYPAYASHAATREGGMSFYAGVPLLTDERQTLGTLCVLDTVARPDGLAPAQLRALQGLAMQVMGQLDLRRALAARDTLLAEQAAALRERDAYAQTLTTIDHAGGEFDAILAAVVTGAMAAVPAAEGGVVELVDGSELEYRAVRGSVTPHRGLREPLMGSLAGACALTKAPILLSDATKDGRVKQDLVARLNLRSCVLAPIMRAGHVLGVLKLQSSNPDAFAEIDLRRASLFAGAATAGLGEVRDAESRRAIHASESRYKAIFDSAIDYAIIVLDPAGIVTDWNKGATHILGWEPGSMCGKPADTFFTPEDRADGIAGKEMSAALETGRGTDERWHLRANGERFWANGEMMVLRDTDGSAVGFVKMLRDRTEQRMAAEAMQAQTELLQTITDHLGQAVFQMTTDGAISFANPAAGTMFGWEPNDLIGQNLHQALHHHHQDGRPFPARECAFVHALEHGRTMRDCEDVFFRRDGTPVQVLATNAPVLTDGAVASAVLTVSDITGRKAAERALSESEARWRGLFEGMQEGFFLGELVRDESGKAVDYLYLEINPAFASQSGLPRESVGRTIRSFVPDLDQSIVDRYARVVETGEPTLFQVDIPGLSRSFEVRASKDTGERFSCLFLDVTARRDAEVRQAALVELGDRLRDLDNRACIAAAATEIAGRTLGLSHAGYAAVDADRETIAIERNWSAPGLAPIPEAHSLRDYGSYVEALKRGETVVIEDAMTDPRTAENGASLVALQAGAFVNLPLMEHGRIVALFFMLSAEMRIWTSEEIGFLRNVADRTRAAIARIEAERQQDLLNHELSHRMKNLLAMVQSIATQTLRSASDITEAKDVLGARLVALGRAHDLLMGGALGSTDIGAVIRDALQLHTDTPDRIRLDGPDLEIGSKQALALALMLHELATNAAKYGALSNGMGFVEIAWEVLPPDANPRLRLVWKETGGPPVSPPTRKGFGTRFIERGLTGQVDGVLELTYPPTGVVCAITGSLAAFQANT